MATPSATEKLLAYAGKRTRLLWDGENGYAVVDNEGNNECHPLKSTGFRNRLRLWSVKACGSMVTSGDILKNVIEALEGAAFSDVAGNRDTVYIDLGDSAWQCVKVTRDGWEVVPHPEDGPYFRRPRNLAEIPKPTHGASMEDWRAFIDGVDEDDYKLIVSFMLACLYPYGPYPILVFLGGQGSGKSIKSKFVKSVDPTKSADEMSVTGIGKLPRDEDSLPVVAYHTRLLAVDNVSLLSPEQSDELCRISTGETNEARKLYTNFDATSISVQRPVLLNGITHFVTKGDLADRCLVINLRPITDRKREAVLWAEFRAAYPALVGAVFTSLSGVLREYENVQLDDAPRMADFAHFGVAVERALAWEAGSFMRAYAQNIETAVHETLANDPIAEKMGELMDSLTEGELEWTGTPGELLDSLTARSNTSMSNRRDWPNSGRALTNRLERLRPLLRQVGIEWVRHTDNPRRLILRHIGIKRDWRYYYELSKRDDVA